MFSMRKSLPPPPSANRPRNESLGATLSTYRNRPSGAGTGTDLNFSSVRSIFETVKRPEVNSALSNLAKNPALQKTVKNIAKDERVRHAAQDPKVRNAAFHLLTSDAPQQNANFASNHQQNFSCAKKLNVEEIARQFESRPIMQVGATTQSFSSSGSSNSLSATSDNKLNTNYPLLTQRDPFEFPPQIPSPLPTIVKYNQPTTNQTSWNNPLFSANSSNNFKPKKLAPSRPPPPKLLPNIFSLNGEPVSSPPLATNEPHAIVRYPYKAANLDELSCKPDDCVLLKREVDEHWIFATNTRTGASGIVPLLFLMIKVPLAPTLHNVSQTAALNSNDTPCSINQRNRQMFGQCIGAKALYDYITNVEGDLTFKAGDNIVVLSRLNEEWLRGELNGKRGIFPLNFVNLENPRDLSKLADESKASQSKYSTELEKGISALSFEGSKSHTVTAAFDYKSETEGDLQFCANDIIEILQRHAGNQWITGRLKRTGEVGLVPLTFTHPPNF